MINVVETSFLLNTHELRNKDVELQESSNLLQNTIESENKTETQTRSFKEAMDILSVKRSILIIGVQGSGKTFLAKSLVSNLKKNEIVMKSTWISNFSQLRQETMKPIMKEGVFIFDEVFYKIQIEKNSKKHLKL